MCDDDTFVTRRVLSVEWVHTQHRNDLADKGGCREVKGDENKFKL